MSVLDELRELAELGIGHANASKDWPVPPDVLLALLDVAEWAERLVFETRYFGQHDDCTGDNCAVLRALVQVEAALARLTEGERAS